MEDNPDLKEGNIINQLDAYNHAIHHGIYNGGRKLFDVEGNIFKYTFKKVIYESEISKKIPSEEAAYLDYCNSDTTCLHPYLKIKEPYMKYKSKISETFQEIEKIIVNYYSVDDLLINNHELHKLIDLLDVLNECREEDQDTKDEEKKLLEAAEYLDTVKNTKTMETMRITEKERHDLLKKREYQAKAMAEKLKKEQEEKLKQQRLENDAAIKRKELEKNQKQQEEQKIKAAQSKIVEDMLVLQRKKRALDQRIRLEVTEKKKFFEEDKMDTLVMDILNQKEVDLKGKKILLNTHTMLSVAAGDTIMISNIVNLFLNTNSHVVILTKYNVGDVFLNNLISNNYTIVQKEDDKEIMDFIDENHTDFACLFFRNHEILQALKGKFYLYKTVLYGLEIHLEGISKLNNNFLYTLTQSEELRNMYIEKGISKEKINILDVITVKYDFELPERKDNEIRLIYSGTLRNEENILEIIEEFQKIHSERPEVVLKIVYGKIVDNGKGFKSKVEKIIENGVKGIIFKNGLSHKDACYEIATSDIGICWRKDGWGDDGQVSTKVKEYELYGVEIMYSNSLFNILYLFKKENIIVPCLNNNEFQRIDYTLKTNVITKNYTKFESVNGSDLNYNEYSYMNYDDIFKKFCKNSELNNKLNVNKILEECVEYEKKNKTKRINTSGSYGNLHTFINIFEYAIKMKLQKILIFEPDVYLHKFFFDKLCEYNTHINESDILYLGASQHNYHAIRDKINSEITQYNNVYKQYYTTGNFGIIYDSNVFQDILYLLKCKLLPSDILPLKLKNNKAYVCVPNIVICDLTSSNTSDTRNQYMLSDKFNWDINLYNTSNIIYIPIQKTNNSDIYLEIDINSYKYNREGFIKLLETDIPRVYLPDKGLKIDNKYYILIPSNVLKDKTFLQIYYNNLFINKINISTISINKKQYITNMKGTYNLKLPFYYDKVHNDYYELLKNGLKCFDDYINKKKVCDYKKNNKNVMFLLHTLPEYEWQGFTKRTDEQLSIIKNLDINLFPCSRYGYPYDCNYINSTNVENQMKFNDITYHKLLNGSDNRFNYSIIDYIKKYTDRVIEFIIENNIGILHANTNFWNGVVAYIVKKLLNIKVIYEIRGFWHDSQNSDFILYNSDMVHAQEKVEHEVIDNIKNIITLSESFKNRLLKNVNENLNIYVIPNIILPFNQEYNKDVLTKYKINICKSKFKIGYIGNLSKYEGLQNLIDAVNSNPSYELLIFGPSPKNMFDYNNLTDNIRYYGKADKEDLYTLYKQFDLVCYPRINTHVTRETQSSKMFEVIYLEIPLILSDLPVNREIHDKLIFHKSNDIADLKEKIHYVHNNYNEYKKMIKEIKLDIIKKYSKENNLKIYKQLYV